MLAKNLKQIAATALAMMLVVGLFPINQLMAFDTTDEVEVVSGGTNLDFGVIEQNETVRKEVKIRNYSSLTVYPVVADSPGYPFNVDHDYTTDFIAPGATGALTFTARSSITGSFSDQAAIVYRSSSGGVWEKIVFDLEVDVVSSTDPQGEVRLSRNTVDFGEVEAGDNTGFNESVIVYNLYNEPVDFDVIDVPDSTFDYRIISSTRRIPANSSLRIEFAFNPTQVNRTYTDYFKIRTDDVDGFRTYTVTLKGRTDDEDVVGLDENLIRDYQVFADSNMYFNNPAPSIDVRFSLAQSSNIDLKVYDQYNNLVTRVFTNRFFSARTTPQTHTFVLNEALNPNRRYRFELRADTTSSPYRYDIDNYELGVTGPYPNPQNGCAGFVDVQPGTPFCDAVEFVVEEGIFTGDTGGYANTLRPNDSLIRAEAVAVMLRAVDASTTSDYPLPFYDVNEYEWYIPYLRKAVSLGAIKGYPDGTFRPYQIMTRAEFYKAFLEMVKRSGRGNFFIDYNVRSRPFADVTLQYSNRWYLPYANWAVRYFDLSAFAERHYGTRYLTDGAPQGYFKPGEPITRGHIIELIYETHVRNVIDY